MNKQDLIDLIISKIYSNIDNEISGDILQKVLIEIVNDCYETNDVFVTSVNYSAATTTLTIVMSNGTYATYKIDIPNPVTIVQSEGQSTEYVMSQKAVTDVFKAIRKSIEDKLLLKVDKTTKINGHTLDKDVELTPDDIGAASKEELKEKITNFKGYWSILETFKTQYPAELNQKGWFAWVGNPYPGEVYVVLADETDWLNTEQVPPVETVDLREYAKTETEDGIVIRTKELAQETGNYADKAISQRLFTTLINKRANGGYFKGGLLQLTCDGFEVGEPIELGGLGIINVTEDNGNKTFTNPNDARVLVSIDDRIVGQIISYRLTTGWVLEMFNGDSIQAWLDDAQWKQYITKDVLDQVSASVEDLRVQVEGLSDDVKSKVDDAFIEQEDEETYYLVLTSNGEELTRVQLPAVGGGGGGGTGVTMKLRAIGGTTIVTGEGSDAIIRWAFTSIDNEDQTPTGDGTITITSNGITVYTNTVPQGEGSFNVRDYINLGRNNVRLRIVDSYGTARSISYTVQKASLTLTSPFSGALYTKSPIAFRYTVTGAGEKTIRFWLNNNELPSETTSSSGVQMTKQLTGMTDGSINTLRVQATSLIDGALVTSNELLYEFIYASGTITTPIIVSSFNRTNVKQFETIKVPYFAYDPANELATVFIYIDNVLVETNQVPRVEQVWEYRVTQTDTMKLELRCGNASRIFNLTVEKSDSGIEEVLADLVFKVKAVGKSNSSSNRDKWEYGSYSTVFNNFNWIENGWLKDKENNTALKLTGDANATINIRPFNMHIPTEGLTYTIEYSTEDVAKDEAVIMEQIVEGVGIKITPTSVSVNSVETGLTSYLDSSSKVSISFSIQKRNSQRLMGIYINGIFSRAIQYSITDSFNQVSNTDLKITTGNRKAIVYVYTVRWYRNNLEDVQILSNYIYDIENSTVQDQLFKKNDIIDAYGNIDYNQALNFIPCMKIIGELPTYKGDKKINTIVFENLQRPNKSFTATDVTNDVQGTSSQFYPRKNFKFKFNKTLGIVLTESGETVFSYALDDTTLPSNVFCTKADFAESSGTHNTGMAIIANEVLKAANILIPEQIEEPKVRTTTFGYPILIFHLATPTSEPEFVGKYNFNYDKAAENTFGFSETTNCESWEFKDNTSDLCLFKGADFDSTFVNVQGQIIPTWTNHLEARFPDGSMNVTNVRKVFEWVLQCKNNPTKFKAEVSTWFNIDNLISYWVITEHYAMVDQRAKNQFLTKYKDGKWRFICYDNDTLNGIDNIGTIKFKWDVESTDIVDNGHVFNGWDSELWKLVKETCWPEIVSMYNRLKSGKMTFNYSMQIFQEHQAEMWAERVYNKDGYYKYIEPLIESGENYLAELQGSRTTHRTWWLKNRFSYMDSKFKTGSYRNDFVSLRLYTPTSWAGVTPNANFTLTTNKPGYIHVKFGQTESDQVRSVPGTAFTINAPSGMQFNDTETIVYGASTLKDLGDLSSKYLGLVDISSATRLESLIIGSTVSNYSNGNFKNLSLGNNRMLKEINLANCPNFGNLDAGSTSSSIDVSKAVILEKFNAANTALKSVTFPESGILQQATLPASTTSLILRNQTSLTAFTLQGYSNVNTLILENIPNINIYNLAKNCLKAPNSNLRKVRLIDINGSDASSTALNAFSLMTGEDDNGNTTNVAVITGKIHINQITQGALDRFALLFPKLVITYSELVNVIDFQDNIVKNIMVANYDTTGDGEVSTEEVTKAVIPAGLLSNSGATLFNEGHHWLGTGSIVSDCPTLKELSIVTGNYSYLNNLPALTKLTVRQGISDKLDAYPLLTPNLLRNVYSITNFVLSGRYIETELKGAILARVNHNDLGHYYYWCFPLRTFPSVVVKEPLVFNDTITGENTYAHNSQMKSLTIHKLLDFTKYYSPNLETVNILGFDTNVEATISLIRLQEKGTAFKTLNISDVNNGTKGILKRIICTDNNGANPGSHVLNIKIDDSVYGNHDSYLYFESNAGVNILDIGANFVPTSFTIQNGGYSLHVPGVKTIVIRHTGGVIPIGGMDAPGGKIIAAYVPDSLLAAYKVATNWSVNADIIYPLSAYTG